MWPLYFLIKEINKKIHAKINTWPTSPEVAIKSRNELAFFWESVFPGFLPHFDLITLLQPGEKTALDFEIVTQGSREKFDERLTELSFDPFAYLRGIEDFLTALHKSKLDESEKTHRKNQIQSIQHVHLHEISRFHRFLNLSSLNLAPPCSEKLAQELKDLPEKPPLEILIPGLDNSHIIYFSKLIQWLKSKDLHSIADILASNNSYDIRTPQVFSFIIQHLQDFCTILCENPEALSPESGLRTADTSSLTKCAEGIHEGLNELELLISINTNKVHLCLRVELSQIMTQTLMPLFEQFKIPQGSQVHFDLTRPLVKMGIHPHTHYHFDAYRLTLSKAYETSIARQVFFNFRQKLIQHQNTLLQLVQWGTHLQFHPDSASHLGLIQRELQEVGYPFSSSNTLAETLSLLSSKPIVECDTWLTRISELKTDAAPTLSDQEKTLIELASKEETSVELMMSLFCLEKAQQAIQHTYTLNQIDQHLKARGITHSPFALPLNPEFAEQKIKEYFSQFLGTQFLGSSPDLSPIISNIISTFLTAPSVSPELIAQWNSLLEAHDGLYQIHDFIVHLPEGSSILPERIVYLTPTGQSLYKAYATDPFLAEWFTGIKFNASAEGSCIRSTPSILYNCLASISDTHPAFNLYHDQLESFLYTPGALNYCWGHLILENRHKGEFGLISQMTDQFAQKAFHSYESFSDVLKDLMKNTADPTHATAISFLQERLDQQKKQGQWYSYLLGQACLPTPTIEESTWDNLVDYFSRFVFSAESDFKSESESESAKELLEATYKILFNSPTIPARVTDFFKSCSERTDMPTSLKQLNSAIYSLCVFINSAKKPNAEDMNFYQRLLITLQETHSYTFTPRLHFISRLIQAFQNNTLEDYLKTKSTLVETIVMYRLNIPRFNPAIEEHLMSLNNTEVLGITIEDFTYLLNLINQNPREKILIEHCFILLLGLLKSPQVLNPPKDSILGTLINFTEKINTTLVLGTKKWQCISESLLEIAQSPEAQPTHQDAVLKILFKILLERIQSPLSTPLEKGYALNIFIRLTEKANSDLLLKIGKEDDIFKVLLDLIVSSIIESTHKKNTLDILATLIENSDTRLLISHEKWKNIFKILLKIVDLPDSELTQINSVCRILFKILLERFQSSHSALLTQKDTLKILFKLATIKAGEKLLESQSEEMLKTLLEIFASPISTTPDIKYALTALASLSRLKKVQESVKTNQISQILLQIIQDREETKDKEYQKRLALTTLVNLTRQSANQCLLGNYQNPLSSESAQDIFQILLGIMERSAITADMKFQKNYSVITLYQLSQDPQNRRRLGMHDEVFKILITLAQNTKNIEEAENQKYALKILKNLALNTHHPIQLQEEGDNFFKVLLMLIKSSDVSPLAKEYATQAATHFISDWDKKEELKNYPDVFKVLLEITQAPSNTPLQKEYALETFAALTLNSDNQIQLRKKPYVFSPLFEIFQSSESTPLQKTYALQTIANLTEDSEIQIMLGKCPAVFTILLHAARAFRTYSPSERREALKAIANLSRNFDNQIELGKYPDIFEILLSIHHEWSFYQYTYEALLNLALNANNQAIFHAHPMRFSILKELSPAITRREVPDPKILDFLITLADCVNVSEDKSSIITQFPNVFLILSGILKSYWSKPPQKEYALFILSELTPHPSAKKFFEEQPDIIKVLFNIVKDTNKKFNKAYSLKLLYALIADNTLNRKILAQERDVMKALISIIQDPAIKKNKSLEKEYALRTLGAFILDPEYKNSLGKHHNIFQILLDLVKTHDSTPSEKECGLRLLRDLALFKVSFKFAIQHIIMKSKAKTILLQLTQSTSPYLQNEAALALVHFFQESDIKVKDLRDANLLPLFERIRDESGLLTDEERPLLLNLIDRLSIPAEVASPTGAASSDTAVSAPRSLKRSKAGGDSTPTSTSISTKTETPRPRMDFVFKNFSKKRPHEESPEPSC